ncbi:hypothetical protein [Lactobacillus phage Sabazios]|nr:hypothetical protein [Lactobacillus phage Sabazios]
MKNSEIYDVVRKLKAQLDEHIGSNGSAHLPATQDTSGFLSATDKYLLDSRGSYANGLDPTKSYDVLTLDFGLYVNRNFTNAPNSVDDSICMVRVEGWGSYKFITFYWLSAGLTFTRSIYSTIDSGWQDGRNWTTMTLASGFTGNIQARKIPLGNASMVEVRVDVHCNISNSSLNVMTTLPTTYRFVSGLNVTAIFTGAVGTSNATAGIILHSAGDLNVYRDQAMAGNLTAVAGTLTYMV